LLAQLRGAGLSSPDRARLFEAYRETVIGADVSNDELREPVDVTLAISNADQEISHRVIWLLARLVGEARRSRALDRDLLAARWGPCLQKVRDMAVF
jgi:hypothetical protein